MAYCLFTGATIPDGEILSEEAKEAILSVAQAKRVPVSRQVAEPEPAEQDAGEKAEA